MGCGCLALGIRPPSRRSFTFSRRFGAKGMIGTMRSRVSFFINKFRRLGFIEYNGGEYSGGIEVHSSLLNVVLYDQPQIRT
jgi:hypothetical protein